MFVSNTSFVNVAASQTDANIVTGIYGKVIRVIGGFAVVAGTAMNITFGSKGSGTGTAITSIIPCGANGGLALALPTQNTTGEPPFGYFETNKGEGLTVTTGAGASITGITLTYVTMG
mgnify:CR=1 FL=1